MGALGSTLPIEMAKKNWQKKFVRDCIRKQRHQSLGKAQAALRGLKERFPSTTAGMVAYSCGICGGFHVGHK